MLGTALQRTFSEINLGPALFALKGLVKFIRKDLYGFIAFIAFADE